MIYDKIRLLPLLLKRIIRKSALKKKLRISNSRKYVSRAIRRSKDGYIVYRPDYKASIWWQNYVMDDTVRDPTSVNGKKFRRRFRVPYPLFEVVNMLLLAVAVILDCCL
jgi:hypothetical protein